ncbi:chromate transporter [Beijerinckia indica]|uniref:Chromate transporter n=1 Tax=Beijerinckia indica subsp. indica (strain ATCC 9039 / DSM 1715 / NCIMB 8712) TaxID=395963 RepID=B2IB72_BEII9|nr:chromate transporter [Beijerinckia indica]ACB95156.1 Chromate transporter [Beijerinckia indica subsp. indica ATCC 9039]
MTGTLWQIISTCLQASLLAIGGVTGTLPEIQRQLVDQHHLMTSASFVRLIAVGQVAPGPNVIVISLLGWSLAGLAGFMAATLAVLLPSSLLTFAVGRMMGRHAQHPWLILVKKALAPVAVGLLFATGWILAGAAYHAPISALISIAMVLTICFTKISPLWGIGTGALIGWLAIH